LFPRGSFWPPRGVQEGGRFPGNRGGGRWKKKGGNMTPGVVEKKNGRRAGQEEGEAVAVLRCQGTLRPETKGGGTGYKKKETKRFKGLGGLPQKGTRCKDRARLDGGKREKKKVVGPLSQNSRGTALCINKHLGGGKSFFLKERSAWRREAVAQAGYQGSASYCHPKKNRPRLKKRAFLVSRQRKRKKKGRTWAKKKGFHGF